MHAHFYQPSREDPLTGVIPDETGSEPYANWNERVNDRCYKPNAGIGNFEKISFNIGPTLVRWMEDHSYSTLEKIAASDYRNCADHGIGNAMAQPYHHTILPLASREDKELQVAWGIADFRHTFGHAPQGMWLPETAVDLESLSVLAEAGIRFTILAPWQAQSGDLDTTQPCRIELPGGRDIVVFFYNDALSSNISFNPESTVDAERFIADHLRHRYQSEEADQIILVASDGELYGHHQPFRDKFLAYLLDGALAREDIRTTTPGLWLQDHPVTQTVQIRENTSWSCMHGVSRWKDVCGCTPNGEWKRGLRDFLDRTAAEVDSAFERTVREWLKDPRQAKVDYIQVVLGEEPYRQWESGQVVKKFAMANSAVLQQLMQAQWERQRMFTSCGWFFEDLDRIEPRNNLKYAAQAVALTETAAGVDIANQVLPLLKDVRSWKNGIHAADLFSEWVGQFKAMAQGDLKTADYLK